MDVVKDQDTLMMPARQTSSILSHLWTVLEALGDVQLENLLDILQVFD